MKCFSIWFHKRKWNKSTNRKEVIMVYVSGFFSFLFYFINSFFFVWFCVFASFLFVWFLFHVNTNENVLVVDLLFISAKKLLEILLTLTEMYCAWFLLVSHIKLIHLYWIVGTFFLSLYDLYFFFCFNSSSQFQAVDL